jgi:Uri superfamily endonuclease
MNPSGTGPKSADPPRQPGSYLLVLRLAASTEIRVGRLGRIGFRRGWYLYSGSAFGPGGLAGRLRHHLRPVQNPHWHIDYLRGHAGVREIWWTAGAPNREHKWAKALARPPGEGSWVRGFGCSDCKCPSHLLYFNRRPGEDLIRSKLGTGALVRVNPNVA